MDKLLPKKIWLAGLGALARAENEGEEWLESLMKDGERYEADKKDDLDQALLSMTERVKEGQQRVRQKVSHIEQTFESKISDALGRMGMVSKEELSQLHERLATLEGQMAQGDSAEKH